MKYQLKIKPRAEKELNRISKADYYRILEALSIITKNPFIGKKMKGQFRHCYTYRSWPYRIIYEIHRKELLILIIKIGHRQGIYG